MVRNGVDTMLCDFCSVIWVSIVKKCNQVWVNDGSNYDSQGSQIPHHVFGGYGKVMAYFKRVQC